LRIPAMTDTRTGDGGQQRRGGVARHDAVAWGYARAASALGVDIIQNCEVQGFQKDKSGAVCGVLTNLGPMSYY
jgi:glycine/D-amino acid oxidase-like deaminating enzyme